MADDNVLQFPAKKDLVSGYIMQCPDCGSKSFRLERMALEDSAVYVYCPDCDGYLGMLMIPDGGM